jgi:hypothetical protein
VKREITFEEVEEALGKVKNPLGVLWGYRPVPIDEDDPPDPEVLAALGPRRDGES